MQGSGVCWFWVEPVRGWLGEPWLKHFMTDMRENKPTWQVLALEVPPEVLHSAGGAAGEGPRRRLLLKPVEVWQQWAQQREAVDPPPVLEHLQHAIPQQLATGGCAVEQGVGHKALCSHWRILRAWCPSSNRGFRGCASRRRCSGRIQ